VLLVLISYLGYRAPQQIYQIVLEGASRCHGAIVEWQSLKMQEYRYSLSSAYPCLLQHFRAFGIRRTVRYEIPPVSAGDYDHALHVDHPEAPSLLLPFLEPATQPHLGGAPNQTAGGEIERISPGLIRLQAHGMAMNGPNPSSC
jgi:hypothetical protein